MTEMSTFRLQKNSLYQKTHKRKRSFRPVMTKHRIKRQVWHRLRTLLSVVNTGLFYIDTRGNALSSSSQNNNVEAKNEELRKVGCGRTRPHWAEREQRRRPETLVTRCGTTQRKG
jgi:hypothetical protein